MAAPRKTYGHGRPFEQWEVMLKDHHDGYIDWAEFERNQKQLAVNAYGKAGGCEVGPWRTGAVGRATLLWALRAPFGGKLFGPPAGTARVSL